jgi:polyisoprenoid-binding protein YceI
MSIARDLVRRVHEARKRCFQTKFNQGATMKRSILSMLAAMLASTLAAALIAGSATAAPIAYKMDPDHTYPSFEADHMGVSVWRGKLNRTSGNVVLDKSAATGSVDLAVDLSSIDFGMNQLNDWAKGPEFFDTAKYPAAQYKGRLAAFSNGVPSQVIGNLTFHGTTKPVVLKINSFKCMPHPVFKRELCGADASATFKRDDFGLDMGKEYGFDMNVTLRIQVEAIQTE